MRFRAVSGWKKKGQFDPGVGLPSFLGLLARLAAFAAAFVLTFPGRAGAEEEFRGLWVVRHTLVSRERIEEVVELAHRGRFNALLVQVRGRGDAYYRSRLVPAGEDLPVEDPDFDPLASVIRRAHRAGLEVHAWVNVFLTWHPGDRMPRSPDHVLLQHPEWFMTSADGIDMGRMDLGGVDLVGRGVEGRYLSPGVPQVRSHLLQIVEEIVRKYDVDGVHLDYVRYPNRHYDYSLAARAAFSRRYRFDPLEVARVRTANRRPSERTLRERLWERWRADQVSLLVEEIRRLLGRLKPHVKFSAAVKPDLEAAYRQFGQDWIRWINSGTLDFVVPMFYTASTDSFGRQIGKARKYVKKGHLYAGIGVYRHATSLETVAQVEQARRQGVKGVVFFSYDSLKARPETLERLRGAPFRDISRVPRMGWKQERYDGAEARTR